MPFMTQIRIQIQEVLLIDLLINLTENLTL